MTSETITVSRDYSGFGVELTTGSRRKQRLSNRLDISMPGPRADVSMRLTIRQARALRDFLSENLDD
tara:strand:- start:80 stop:280 length:201 start_codon:yes stop_codon:yes gene_type:complete